MSPLVSSVAILLVAATSTAAVELSPKARAEQVLSRAAYQTELPNDRAHTSLGSGSIDSRFEHALVALGCAALIVAVGALAYALIRRVGNSRPRAGGSGARPVPARPRAAPPADVVGPTLTDADRLAELGRFRDAVHALLLIAIGATARSASWSFPPSATGRELLRLVPLEGERHDGFGALVRMVERSVFGGRDVSADDYAACRERCVLVSRREAA